MNSLQEKLRHYETPLNKISCHEKCAGFDDYQNAMRASTELDFSVLFKNIITS